MEKALKEVILRDSPLAWWEWEVVHDVVVFNDLKVKMLGYEPEEFKGKGYRAFTNLVHPDDREKAMDAMRDLLTGRKKIYQVDYRIIDSAGMYHWYMDRGVVMSFHDGAISMIRGIVIDLGLESQSVPQMETVVNLLQQYSEDRDKLIILCSNCEQIRLRKQEWVPFHKDILAGIGDTLSHGICPSCLKKLYPEVAERILAKNAGKH
jgi:PAS domain S-box-containing protein